MRNEKNTERRSPATAATSAATDQEAPAGRIDEQTSSQVRDTLEERGSGEEQLTLTVWQEQAQVQVIRRVLQTEPGRASYSRNWNWEPGKQIQQNCLTWLISQNVASCMWEHVCGRCMCVCVCVGQKGLPFIFGSILCKNSTLCVTLRLFWPAAKRERERKERQSEQRRGGYWVAMSVCVWESTCQMLNLVIFCGQVAVLLLLLLLLLLPVLLLQVLLLLLLVCCGFVCFACLQFACVRRFVCAPQAMLHYFCKLFANQCVWLCVCITMCVCVCVCCFKFVAFCHRRRRRRPVIDKLVLDTCGQSGFWHMKCNYC